MEYKTFDVEDDIKVNFDVEDDIKAVEEVPEEYVNAFNQIQKKGVCYDPEEDLHYYDVNVAIFLRNRYESRFRRLKWLKSHHNLPHTIDDMFKKVLDFMYYEKTMNYPYFMKKICELYNIPNNISVKTKLKYETMWKEFCEKYSISKNYC